MEKEVKKLETGKRKKKEEKDLSVWRRSKSQKTTKY